MATQKPNTRILRDLDDALERMMDRLDVDLDRVQILAGALAGFVRPVPDYEPRFHHLRQAMLNAHELGG